MALIELAQDGGGKKDLPRFSELRPRRVDSQTVSSSAICGISCFGHGALVAP